MDVIKVSANSRTSAVAGAIAGVVREHKRAEVQAIGAGGQALDGGDGTARRLGDRHETRALNRAVDMHRAGAALADATTELGAFQLQVVAQYPQQGRAAIAIEGRVLAIDLK
jgi:hypothetical protein